MKLRGLATALACAALTATMANSRIAWSQPADEAFRTTMNNVGHEATECAAYTAVVSALLSRSPNSEALRSEYEKVGGLLLQRARIIAQTIGQKEETILARLNMSMEEMKKLINNDVANTSILLNKYASHCKIVAEDVESRVSYWMGKAEADDRAMRRK